MDLSFGLPSSLLPSSGVFNNQRHAKDRSTRKENCRIFLQQTILFNCAFKSSSLFRTLKGTETSSGESSSTRPKGRRGGRQEKKTRLGRRRRLCHE